MTHDIEAVAMRAARAAGKVHLARLLKTSISYKANAIDLVTEADREAEAAVIGVIRRSFPDHAVLGEESGASAGRNEDRGERAPMDNRSARRHHQLRPRLSAVLRFDRL